MVQTQGKQDERTQGRAFDGVVIAGVRFLATLLLKIVRGRYDLARG